MEDNKIRVGITQGDINGVGYEVILKTFADPVMLELCTPIIYGSPKVAAYHRKSLDLPTNFSIVNSASEAVPNRLSVVNCTDDEVKVEFSKPDVEAGKAALGALEKAIEEYKEGMIDVIVTAPINKHTIQSEEFAFPGHTEYIEQKLGDGEKALMILMKDDFRVALVTGHIPVKEIAGSITKELIQEKLKIFNRSLKQDFAISAPRIAVLSLNPHAGDGGLLGTEEQEIIIPAINEMAAKGMLCYGPYPADGFMGSDNFTHFDGILAMYHDQGHIPLKVKGFVYNKAEGHWDAVAGVNVTLGLPIIRASVDHGTGFGLMALNRVLKRFVGNELQSRINREHHIGADFTLFDPDVFDNTAQTVANDTTGTLLARKNFVVGKLHPFSAVVVRVGKAHHVRRNRTVGIVAPHLVVDVNAGQLHGAHRFALFHFDLTVDVNEALILAGFNASANLGSGLSQESSQLIELRYREF